MHPDDPALAEPTPVRSKRGLLVDWGDERDYSWGSGAPSREGADDDGEAELSEGDGEEAESPGATSLGVGEA
eukprot:4508559-Alexandrium_andersonii.AAC.1